MFFVHTSLVLMMSLDRMRMENGRLFGSFYVRRFFRIYPLSIACLLEMYFAHFRPEVGRLTHYASLKELAANLTLTQNLFYIDDMLGVLWSLPLEVQMYIFLPFLFLLARASKPRVLFAVWVASVLLGIVQFHTTGRLNVIGYAPCFIPGIIAWKLIPGRQRRAPGLLWPVALAAVAAIWFTASMELNMYFRWIFCLILGITIPYFAEIPVTWVAASCKAIAKYSYGIYLTHQFTMAISFVILRNPLAQWCTFIALGVLLPLLAYHLIEHPGIELGRRIAARIERTDHPAPLIRVSATAG
jgi:peptidoglycan/LPS O-acetylase OafA/YrhL